MKFFLHKNNLFSFKLLDKFRLDLDDEKAISYLKDLIDSSIGAIVPQVYDYFHNLLLAFR